MHEEVRCLQQYLNSHGYPVATTGVGSQGKETTEFKALTQAAVMKWQIANGVTPATGYFGAKSRAKLAELISGGSSTPTPTPVPPSTSTDNSTSALLLKIAQLEQKLKDASANQDDEEEEDDSDGEGFDE
jgi:peptidoglycan hydrolase-like protein with peptidoglycan-binding domain